jgi:hypothetical protein
MPRRQRSLALLNRLAPLAYAAFIVHPPIVVSVGLLFGH